MQQVNTTSQQQTIPFTRTPPNKNTSHSPQPRMLFPQQDNYTPQKPQSYTEIDLLYQKVSLLQNENKILKTQLENANLQIQQLSNKINNQPNQGIFKTTTFELVVLQKAVEQLESLKQVLKQRKQNNNITLPTEETDIISELKSKVIQLEQKNQILNKENSELQQMILFPQSIQSEFSRETRRLQLSDPSEIRQINKNSPIRLVKQKGSPCNPYRSPKLIE